MNSDPGDARLAEAIAETRRKIEQRLAETLKQRATGPRNIHEALEYTLLDGGKRLRPLLCIATHDGLEGDNRDACLDVACALECLHTYSLIHDDLPCMDDDDMRRGKPSCHKRFGEAIAVLAGDALLTMCFEILLSLGHRWGVDSGIIVETTGAVAHAAGVGGLITGQALDLMSAGLEPVLDTVEEIHVHKTAALISASMHSGAIIAGADVPTKERVARAGRLAGHAFQIVDDILDVRMSRETLGKTPGKDAREGKLTYPALVGVESSQKRAVALIENAKEQLPERALGSLLGMLLDFVVKRSN
jgi:geranylgeranyl diphosphate synthase type II